MYVCMYIYIYIYTHVYTHTHEDTKCSMILRGVISHERFEPHHQPVSSRLPCLRLAELARPCLVAAVFVPTKNPWPRPRPEEARDERGEIREGTEPMFRSRSESQR